MRVQHFTVVRLEAVGIRVLEVRVVDDLVKSTHVLERIGVVIHFSHVVVLEDGTNDVLRNFTDCVAILEKLACWVGLAVNVYR